MASSSFTATLTLAMVIGLAPQAPAQEKIGSAPPQTKPKAGGAAKAGATKSKTEKSAPAKDAEAKIKTEKATFGGGCFWCLEAVFERIPGVKNVVSGYAGGTVPRPSYEMVSSGLTGHAEVVQIEFDPEVVSFDKLLDVFWHCHDPTSLNAQGPDFGTQYRSIILYQSADQKLAAEKSYRELMRSAAFASPIVTELVPLKAFYAADRHHQDYYRRNRTAAYCQEFIVPKLRKLNLKLR